MKEFKHLLLVFVIFCCSPIIIPLLPLFLLGYLIFFRSHSQYAKVLSGSIYIIILSVCQLLCFICLPFVLAALLSTLGAILIGIFQLTTRFHNLPKIAPILGPILSLFGAIEANESLFLATSSSANRIPITDIASFPDAVWLSFADATVQSQWTYTRYIPRKSGKHGHSARYDHIAPLTTSNWTPDQPVPAWALCENTGSTCKEWKSDWHSTRTLLETERFRSIDMISLACSKHHLNCPPAPVLVRVKNRDDEIYFSLKMSYFGISLSLGICGFLLPLFEIRTIVPSKK